MREPRSDQPEIDPEAVGADRSEEHNERDGFMRYIGTQVGMWALVAVLFVIALIAIIVYANIY